MGNNQITGLSSSLRRPLLGGGPERNICEAGEHQAKTKTAIAVEQKQHIQSSEELLQSITEHVQDYYKKHPFGLERFYPEEPFAGKTAQSLHNATRLVRRLGLPDRVILEGTPRDALVIARWNDPALLQPPNLIAEFTFRSFSWNYNGGGPHGLLRFFALIEYKNHDDFVLRPVLPVTSEEHFILVRKCSGWEVELDRRIST